MIYVSLVEIFQKSVEGFANAGYDDGAAATFGTTAFFGGVVFMFLCDQAVHWIEERAHRRRTGGEGGDDGMGIEEVDRGIHYGKVSRPAI